MHQGSIRSIRGNPEWVKTLYSITNQAVMGYSACLGASSLSEERLVRPSTSGRNVGVGGVI